MQGEKGFTGIDIAISIVVLFILVSILATLLYTINSGYKEVEYKSKATEIAVDLIENIKIEGFETYKDHSEQAGNSLIGQENEPVTGEEGFFKTITVKDYTDLEGKSEETSGILKIVTVNVSYMFKGKEQTVELSTLLSEES